ncbi:hypothetical protein E3Q13_02844 [Wallemia mellicola]|uniref:Uncharacterized protein n=1 Tax=Wallemia mellicola TaxID=1708541 RepID=A0AB38MWM0_9BASI|nr:hypothetical protein E3Q13_02844 [Wallemia mellicola]TIC65577.1 hypothetical protein E3Q02_02132 [Wallemia mellicola]
MHTTLDSPLSLALAQTSYLHGLIRRGEVYQARKMSLAFARAAARAPNGRYPFSRRRLPLKTMSSIIHSLIGQPGQSSTTTYSKPNGRPTYSFLYLISQFPTPGARAARMFVSHHAKLGDRRALRDFLVILIFGLLSAEMIGGAVALYSHWCRKYAVSEAQKSSMISQNNDKTTKAVNNLSTSSHITWQPSKSLIKVLLNKLHTSRDDPYKQMKAGVLSHVAQLLDDRIRIGNLSIMVSELSSYTRKHKSSQYTRQFERTLESLSEDIISGRIFHNTKQRDYKRVKDVNASTYNALISHFMHLRDMTRVQSLLESFNNRYGAVRSDTLNAVLSASVEAGDIQLATRLVELLQWKLNYQYSNKSRWSGFRIAQDEKVLKELKKCNHYNVDDNTVSALLKFYVATGNKKMVAPLTYQYLPHLDLNTVKEDRESSYRKLDEQTSSDLFAAVHRTLKTGLAVRLLNDRQLENMSVESLTSVMTILSQEARKWSQFSTGWGPKRWIRSSFFESKSTSDLNNDTRSKQIHDQMKLRHNSANFMATTLYKSVRNRPSKHQVDRNDVSIDEGFLRMCLKVFHRSKYMIAIDDVLMQLHQRNYTIPHQHKERFEWIKMQDPQLIFDKFNKSRVPIVVSPKFHNI